MLTHFLWDNRPGRNLDHIAVHGMTAELWEEVFSKATHHAPDKDDPDVTVAEGRVKKVLYRLFYIVIDAETVLPVSIYPITGFPIKRRSLR